jgi:hypothetical protein
MMKQLLTVLTLCGLAAACISATGAQTTQIADAGNTSAAGGSSSDYNQLPPAPPGKSTIMGGQIRNVDPVRDQFSLLVYGERPMKILYDERTQVYRDGARIPLRDLGPEDHASVQTVLDGTAVFALSIHILSQTPQGECEGAVESFNPDTHELAISSALSPQPVTVLVPANTLVSRVGQSTFSSDRAGLSDLVNGTLVSARFSPVRQGIPVASQISILAVPGSHFVLAGEISFLDLDSGLLDLVDPRDEKSYRIYFDSDRLPVSRKIRLGDHVRVAATYQAPHYVADDISIYPHTAQ